VAIWQADFEVLIPSCGLPADYRLAVAQVLPPGKSWMRGLEVWGTEEGDRIDVFTKPGSPPEVLARFDLREWKPAIYEDFLVLVRSVRGQLRTAESGAEVAATFEDFTRTLLESRAARFVQDPRAYLDDLKKHPIEWPEEP